MKLICHLIVLIVSLATVQGSFANEQFDRDIADAREIYLEATDGDTRAIRKSLKKIRELERKYPSHPLVLAYKGATLSLRGINIGKRPLDRMRETEEGLNILDRVLRKLENDTLPYLEDVQARLLSAYVFINLPDAIFHRLKEGNRIIEKLLVHPRLAGMPQGLQAAIYFAAATSAEKHNDRDQLKHYLELTVSTDPDGKNGQEAKIKLQEIVS